MDDLSVFKDLVPQFESYLLSHQPQVQQTMPAPLQELAKSMQYSLGNGGKRFRPALSLLTAQTLGQPIEKVLPVAFAVECIHTYSLIHDDLPCMDNDDERRGQPTNHKIYGEALALLAGDGLLTLAFQHLSNAYKNQPAIAGETIRLISDASGWNGMVGGQSVDIFESDAIKKKWIDFIHENKTGALIRVSVEAAAVACEAPEVQRNALREFAALLGYGFQLADDILDWDPKNPEATSYTSVFGLEKTQAKLKETSDRSLTVLQQGQLSEQFLQPIVAFNLQRNL